ncbi:hypothetical protein BDB01DRAFT_846883 [Pilobolus umbonatus]|nr:hypothetical protein BDB01DRAFT_846883 [Pilobolus umbonatus]
MDTAYSYTQLFDMEPFVTDVLHGTQASTMPLPKVCDMPSDDEMTSIDSPVYQPNKAEPVTQGHNSFNTSNSYLDYIHSASPPSNSNTIIYDQSPMTPTYHPQITSPTLDNEYACKEESEGMDYGRHPSCAYESSSSYPNYSICIKEEEEEEGVSHRSYPYSINYMMRDSIDHIRLEHTMPRGYVSLSDVNSFVAKADSIQHSCLFQLSSNNDYLEEHSNGSESGYVSGSQQIIHEYSSDNNEDTEDEFTDSDDHPWSCQHYSPKHSSSKEKLMIKIRKPSSHSLDHPNDALPTPYPSDWDLASSKDSTGNLSKSKYRKSMSNVCGYAAGYKRKSKYDPKRRYSVSNKLNSQVSLSPSDSTHSSSSLSSLNNQLQRSMKVSSGLNNIVKMEYDDTMEICKMEADDHEEEEDEEDDDDDDEDEYQVKSVSSLHQVPVKKGRNVDKACNHCKRSHLRCDDMRPCRRCVSTGKTGCKDVQHKPRGRPKLHKK